MGRLSLTSNLLPILSMGRESMGHVEKIKIGKGKASLVAFSIFLSYFLEINAKSG
jgi:hypothetical protein